jgi:NodT family efflux transporter outer membrane factor (OMF) lipoprotein
MLEPFRRPLRSLTALALAALALSACGTVPNLGPKPQPKAPAAYATARSFAAPAADWPADRWWDAYQNPELSKLIDEALTGSPTLAQAQARLRAAQAQAEQSRAATLPTLAANGQIAETEASRAIGFPPFIQELLPKGYQPTARVTLDASYDLDLFGKNRAALAAAVSEAQAARADAAQARLTLSTAVAQAYGDFAHLEALRAGAVATLRIKEDTAKLVSDRVHNGLDTKGELAQGRAAVPAARADLELLDEEILIARHRIAALLGAGPDRGLDIPVPADTTVKAFGLPQDLAANLVGRRPDVIAARLRAEAQADRIKAAHAAFYPNITLNAYIGQQSLGLGEFFKPVASIGSIGPAINLPIFEGGRLQGAYRGARADYDASVAAYDLTLTQALQDVADSAASIQSVQQQLAQRRQAVASGETAYAIAKLRYQGGLSTYVSVLTAEEAVIAERRGVTDAQARAFTLDIALVRALGGGFNGS